MFILSNITTMKKIKKYFVDDFDSEVYAVSLVEKPAIESDFVYFSNQKEMLFSDDEKRMVSGPVLRPNFPIYRINEYGEEYFIEFSKKAVERLAAKYLHYMSGNNWTIDHERYAEGVYTVESWIKTDNVHDKSIALGLDPNLEVGTWFLSTKIDNNDLWNEIKNGNRFFGFSVEALISLYEADMFNKQNKDKNNDEKMNENTLFERIEELFKSYFSKPETQEETEVKEEVKLEEETVEPQAEEQTEPQQEQPQEEPQTETEVQEEVALEEQPQDDYKEEVENLRKAVEELTAKLGEANKQITELSKQPSAEPVNVKASAETKGESVMDTIRALRDGSYFKA